MIWQFEAVPLQSEEAVRKLIAERGLPKNFTGTIEYHGIKIVVRRPKSFTWEQNTRIQDLDQVWGYGGADGVKRKVIKEKKQKKIKKEKDWWCYWYL